MERTVSGAVTCSAGSASVRRQCRRIPRPSRHSQICRASGKQQKGLVEPAAATKVRVERQTHLPASREEAWGALRQLAPEHAWKELSPVLAALESIYRAEMHIAGEEALQALRSADEALVELTSDTPSSSRSGKGRAGAAERTAPTLPGTPLEGGSKKKERSSKTSASSKGSSAEDAEEAERASRKGFDQIPTDPAGLDRVEEAYQDEKQRAHDEAVDMADRQDAERGKAEAEYAKSGSNRSSSNGNGSSGNANGTGKVGLQLPDAEVAGRVAYNVAQNLTRKAQETLEEAQESGKHALSSAVGLEDAPEHEDSPESSDAQQDKHAARMAEVADPEEGLRVESASRLDWDRDRWLRRPLNAVVNPVKADSDFMSRLLFLLRKAHFSQLNDRDEAMSRSLNSDYLDQLLIKADTSGLDADLVRPAAEERPVPEEEQALLVFKRGYGQARRKGRMLVAKLDYLQLIVIKGSLANVGKKAQQLWHAVSTRVNPPDTLPSGKSSSELAEQEEETAGEKLRGGFRKVGDKLSEWGILSPRLMLAGGGLFMTLSNWGLLPAVDVLPLERFNAVWRPNEPDRLTPVYVERVTIREALQGDLLPSLFGTVQLIEPTFGEVLLLYRRKSSPGWLRKVKDKVFGEEENGPRLMRREPIMLRVLRDIPVPSWKLVLPDKLLQFRPLDGLRADLVTVAGLLAFVAQAKYDSFILEIITIASATSLLSRVVLGYWRLAQRNEKLAIQVLAESTLAAQEGCIHYLAAAAGLQQWGQAALAFLALWKSEQGLSAAQLGEAVETTLEDSFRVRVRFDVEEALKELTRLELVEKIGGNGGNGNGSGGSVYKCVKSEDAVQHLDNTWRAILQSRLQSVQGTSDSSGHDYSHAE